MIRPELMVIMAAMIEAAIGRAVEEAKEAKASLLMSKAGKKTK
jgi:hypothetical protein